MEKYNKHWDIIRNGFLKIINEEQTKISFEELYRSVYIIVLECEMHQQLILDINDLLEKYSNLLNEKKIKMLNDVILYLRRTKNYKIIDFEQNKKSQENECMNICI